MQVHFNYRYYLDDVDYQTYNMTLTQYIDKAVARQLYQVGDVVAFAEQMQAAGYYVALYLPYEAAPFYNEDMATCIVSSSYIYAAAYVFADAVQGHQIESIQQTKNKHQFQFILPDDTLTTHIKTVQQEIVNGNTYQVNYTTRLKAPIQEPISTLYNQLRCHNNGNYGVLLDTDEIKVASASPELFFQQGDFQGHSNMIVSKPMKGTIARGVTPAADAANYERLRNSSKDQAENVMIVDLLRNDIARIAQTDTVKVYNLFAIEMYHTVYQMTSMVSGKLRTALSLNNIMAALFPCGSITGAPKLNTMKYIKQLEQVPRNIYCGTIGLLLPEQRAIFNVPIRTLQYIENEAVYGVGAGITIDSDPQAEIQEFKDKSKILGRL
ncbi:anthranilate synthase component I family protein [Staphylococcus arlettae]|uniref:chorismate-binding protein n=1 Tax=Staphylococcus TaxID=1279 RepID=UPI000D1A0258|nr:MULTISPECIES: anthranilate synthase component I family protein [Staphylococcus]KAB2481192.1 anthranilate synthase component I family protein [Staphylococcus sp. CH99b_3]MCD8841602.1 anthranilate synthase component I family protein [Staphylococcus arlettae]MCD8907057.1 anthranilate synthase component I family protein [Staphylococcus arlettae]MCE4984639.1 anthranilate synthase component I family protein [Staphylococcus arlettae]MEB5898419.1 anthranilate synthase component I family protein [St